jgi:hypothetical protein
MIKKLDEQGLEKLIQLRNKYFWEFTEYQHSCWNFKTKFEVLKSKGWLAVPHNGNDQFTCFEEDELNRIVNLFCSSGCKKLLSVGMTDWTTDSTPLTGFEIDLNKESIEKIGELGDDIRFNGEHLFFADNESFIIFTEWDIDIIMSTPEFAESYFGRSIKDEVRDFLVDATIANEPNNPVKPYLDYLKGQGIDF